MGRYERIGLLDNGNTPLAEKRKGANLIEHVG